MERYSPQSIGDILRLAFQENCMQQHLDESKAASLWETVVGKTIAEECKKPFVREREMWVGVPNASLRHELNMSRTKIKNSINSFFGKEIIKDIRFTS